MTSEKQIAANRRNAARSTGPTTAEGKTRSSRNALRHGLSRPASPDAAALAEIGEFALQLVGEDASPTEVELARAAAAADLDLRRIRRQRSKLLEVLSAAATAPAATTPGAALPCALGTKGMTLVAIGRLGRYERTAEARRNRALGRLARRRRLPIFK